MAAVQRKLVHKQFNSPIGMYSDDNVKETLDREMKALSNGAVGIDFSQPNTSLPIPSNLKNSAVLRMLEEQEYEKTTGYKKVQWPPNDAHYVKGSTPQPSSCPSQQPQQESGDHYQPQQNQPNYPQRPPQSQGHSESYPPKQQQYYQQQQPQHQAHPQQQYHPPQQQPHPYSQQQNRPYNQPQQQQFPRGPASSTVSFSGGVAVNKPVPSQPPQAQYQQPYQQHQQPPYQQHQQPQSPQYQQPQQQYHQPQHQYQAPQQQQHQQQHYQPPQQQHYQPPQQQHYQPPQQQHQPQSPSGATLSPSYQPTAPNFTHPRSSVSPKGWHHVNAAHSPTRFGFTQPQPQHQSGAPTSFGSERDLGSHQQQYQSQAHHAYEQSVNQYQTSSHQQPIQYYQQHHQHSNKFETYSQEPQSYGQPQHQHQQQHHQQHQQQHHQQHQGYVPTQHQNGRGQSPGIITLRKEAPITQQPAPVYASQPAALGYKGGCNMRGDLKWPPPEYKAQAAAENEERLKLAKQPATRPLLVKKDYSSFFAKHALNSTYPAYKAPPGTQHYPQYAQY